MKEDKKMIARDEQKKPYYPVDTWEEMDDLFNRFREDMDRMFWDPFGMNLPKPRLRVLRTSHFMPMNIEDEGDRFSLTVEMPGVRKEDTKISLDEDLLTISVNSKEEKEEKEKNYLLRERSSYSCERSVRLPSEIFEDKVSAKMDNGVLHVTLPKKHPKDKVKKTINVE